MTIETLLAMLLAGAVAFVVGWATAWRLARKLDHFGVSLQKWDQPYDLQKPETRPARIIHGSEFGG